MKKVVLGLAVFMLLTVSCNKWFEGDLEEQSVVILTPMDGLTDSIQTKTFYWEELADAMEYELQVVTPSFDSILSVVLDTIVTDNNFSFTFSSGDYEWRIKAINSSTETDYSYGMFSIVTATSLAGQTIILEGPNNQLASTDSVFEFSWMALESADQYLFRILDNSDGSEVYSSTETTNSVSYTFSEDGQYRWTVQALNAVSASNTAENYLIIDRETPNAPALSAPSELDTISRFDIDFSWIQNASQTSTVFDSLFIAEDSLFTSANTYLGVGQSYSLDSLDVDTYYWRVKSYDEAGNEGEYSTFRTLTVE